ncbi:MAG: molybdopterin molybdotransferase MoeA [Magnetococcales bacterium]|nr:molybdopterin molybdotransferase MoeA [Magnetococcales bacterium]
MISFYEARRRVFDNVMPVPDTEWIPTTQALGRVLNRITVSPVDVPNHDNSAMDGYAIRTEDLAATGETRLRVTAYAPAGTAPLPPLAAGEAARIMTGSPIPPGCDCVVIQENVSRDGDWVIIPAGQKKHQHIRRAGEDIRRGGVVLSAGRRLRPADMGLLTSLGMVQIEVKRRVRVAILSTGNEVVAAGEPLPPGCVHDSNRTAIMGCLTALGCEVIDLGLVRDHHQEIAAALRHGSEVADAVISSGGVSEGDLDLVKTVLSELGSIVFWKVAMKPGKPQAYGRLGKAAFFGLPGNPVSSLAVLLLVVRPALLRLMGAIPELDERLQLPLKGGWHKRHDRMEFLRGFVHFDPDGAWVESIGGQGSGMLTGLAAANAFIALPEEVERVEDEGLVDVWLIRYD